MSVPGDAKNPLATRLEQASALDLVDGRDRPSSPDWNSSKDEQPARGREPDRAKLSAREQAALRGLVPEDDRQRDPRRADPNLRDRTSREPERTRAGGSERDRMSREPADPRQPGSERERAQAAAREEIFNRGQSWAREQVVARAKALREQAPPRDAAANAAKAQPRGGLVEERATRTRADPRRDPTHPQQSPAQSDAGKRGARPADDVIRPPREVIRDARVAANMTDPRAMGSPTQCAPPSRAASKPPGSGPPRTAAAKEMRTAAVAEDARGADGSRSGPPSTAAQLDGRKYPSTHGAPAQDRKYPSQHGVAAPEAPPQLGRRGASAPAPDARKHPSQHAASAPAPDPRKHPGQHGVSAPAPDPRKHPSQHGVRPPPTEARKHPGQQAASAPPTEARKQPNQHGLAAAADARSAAPQERASQPGARGARSLAPADRTGAQSRGPAGPAAASGSVSGPPRSDLPLYCEIDGLAVEIQLQDLSSGGLFVQTPSPPPLDSEVEVFLQVGSVRVEASGHVVQSLSGDHAKRERRRPGFGLLFTRLDDDARAALRDAIEVQTAARAVSAEADGYDFSRPATNPGFATTPTPAPARGAQPAQRSSNEPAAQPQRSDRAQAAQTTARRSNEPAAQAQRSDRAQAAEPAPPVAATAADSKERELLAQLKAELARVESQPPWTVLGISQSADLATAREAFFAASKRYHPHAYARYALPEIKTVVTQLFIVYKKAFAALTKSGRSRTGRAAGSGSPPMRSSEPGNR
jgi:PilZ domain